MKKKVLVLVNHLFLDNADTEYLYYSETLSKNFLFNNKTKINLVNSNSDKLDEKKINLEKIKKYNRLFYKDLLLILESILKKKFIERFWNILLGPWFHHSLEVFYNRYYSIKYIVSKYNIDEVIIDKSISVKDFAKKNTLQFFLNLNSPVFNAYVYQSICTSINVKFRIYDSSFNSLFVKKNFFFKKFYNKFIFLIITIILRNKKILIVDTYFSKIKELILNINLRTVPILFFRDFFEDYNSYKFYYCIREKIIKKYTTHDNEELKCIKTLLVNSFPRSLLENFNYFSRKILKYKVVNKIKYIITAQNFDTNEYFKYFAAYSVLNNCKIFYIQHGNQDGTNKFDLYENPAETSDVFFTWGWKIRDNNKILFNVKVSGQERNHLNKKLGTNLIFFLSQQPIRRNFFDVKNIYYKQHFNEFIFIENISKNILKSTIIKEHPFNLSYESDDKSILESKIKKINHDIKICGLYDLKKNLKKVKISVYSYDSTGFYEHLSLNKPVIAFWADCFDDLREEAIIYYKSLFDANIIFSNPVDAANHINKHWNNINDWWFSFKTQKAVNYFISKYSIYENKPISIFKDKLLDLIK